LIEPADLADERVGRCQQRLRARVRRPRSGPQRAGEEGVEGAV